MSEKETTPPQASQELEETQLESVAGGGLLDDAIQAVTDFFTGGSETEGGCFGGGGGFGGGGASGSW